MLLAWGALAPDPRGGRARPLGPEFARVEGAWRVPATAPEDRDALEVVLVRTAAAAPGSGSG